jgi:predicted dehydrogenase
MTQAGSPGSRPASGAATPIGIIGCGNIFAAYVNTLKRCRAARIVAIADADHGLAERRGAEHGVPVLSIDDLLASPAQIILNLTPPQAHHAVGLKVLNAGKHFFTEKPLAASFEQGLELVELARAKGLRLGCAPDTFLGAASQTLRALVDAGTVGPIRHGTAQFMNHGPDHWHPNPAFFYQPGAGPLHDVGVYYLTHLVNHLGPVARLSSTSHITHAVRTITLGPRAGQTLPVAVPTHVVTQLAFDSGAHIVLTSSFDVWRHSHTPMELYGEQGTLLGADPNRFGGTVRHNHQTGAWQRATARRPYHSNCRGIGLIDMAQALQQGRAHRCSAEMALHVLEIMDRALDAGRSGQPIALTTRCERPAPLDGKLF